MRIAQLTYSTKPRGGVVHTLALAEQLAARGHTVEVWTLARGGDQAFFRPVDPRVEVHAVDFPPVEGEGVGERIERSIATMAAAFDSDAEIVHAQDCISANAVADAGRDCIRTIHHLDEFTTPKLVACHERAIVEPVARLCVSAAVAGQVRDRYGLEPPVIPNGVDAARFAAAAGSGAGSRFRDGFGDYVLALGGIEPRKGSIDLLEGFARLRETRPDLAEVQLVFGGGETLFDYRPYRARFEERAAELGIDPVILGTLADEDVPPLVAGARCLGFVSVNEGFGLAAMEALAADVPVVARDIPVIHDVFGATVAYAADTDAIGRELAAAVDGSTPPDRVDAGRRLATAHTWAAAAQRHEEFYREVATCVRPRIH
ncbi:MSMEG_0565 family glycosyltransferase [Corynebacterium variabile]|uniref:Glycosyltransferase, MSMEG_0565 family n=1 Tax=Corynebacterium variabile TaxID=1727 RepID=A0A0X2NMH6_9CORY|nr:MSMEG_0565 family glycosyltransferase [Corynebacterium variabile]CUU66685.1 glycosyltransferase, MSMEG_0565 family [Corynebacterium variabile]